MNTSALPAVVILVVGAFVGSRSTFRVFRTYHRVAPALRPRDRLIGQAFVVTCAIITSVAFFFGVVATRSLLGFERLEWGASVSLLLSIAVFAIPPYIDYVIARLGDRA